MIDLWIVDVYVLWRIDFVVHDFWIILLCTICVDLGRGIYVQA